MTGAVTVQGLTVRPIGPDDAAVAHAIIHAAFAARPPLDPPAPALLETEASVRERLAAGGGLLALVDDQPAGVLLLDPEPAPAGATLHLRRFGVLPTAQGHGVATRLVEAAVEAATGLGAESLTVVAREELPATVAFWRHQGFHPVRREPPSVVLRRSLATRAHAVPTAEAMQDLGRRLGELLRAGDLVVLTGGLGAGKTTLTQGLAAGLGVRGGVTSPTFVISRVHPSTTGGPALVHVDAYRLGGAAELDDLDLDASLDDVVTVVEWGEGLAEGLADSRLEVRIARAEGGTADGAAVDVDDGGDDELDPRVVEVTPVGPRWRGVELGVGS